VHRVRDDVIMRWAQWLSSDWTPVWSDGQRHADVSSWVAPIRGFSENEKQLARRIRRREEFAFNISELGPTRVLRRMARSPGITLARFDAGAVAAEVELSDGRVSGASTTHHKRGTDALAEILTLQSASVEICFPSELTHGELMLRAAEAFDEAVIRLLDSEEEMTTRGDYSEAVADAVASARALSPAAHAGDCEDGKDSTPVGTSHGATAETRPPQRHVQARRRRFITFAVTALAAATLTIGVWWLVGSDRSEAAPSQAALAAPARAASRAQPAAHGKTQAKPRTLEEPAEPAAGATTKGEPNSERLDPAQTACDGLDLEASSSEGERGAGLAVKQGRLALLRGNVKLAERRYCQAVRLAPSGPMYEQLAKFYIEHGDARQGQYWAERALEKRSGSLEAQLLSVDARIAQGATDEARADLYAVLKISDRPSVRKDRVRLHYSRLGATTLRGSDAGQSARFYRRAIMVDPAHPEPHAGLAHALLLQDDAKGALAAATHAVENSKRFPPARRATFQLVLGDAHDRLGDRQSAAEAWSQALSLDPANRGARERLSRVTSAK
jgi:tetratricopeptide (TPR) repeat protein